MNKKKYLDRTGLTDILDKLKEKFASLIHTHTKEDITDYIVDVELSSTSTNPVENKVIKAEFDLVDDKIQTDIDSLRDELKTYVDEKSPEIDVNHDHDDKYYTEEEIDAKFDEASGSYETKTDALSKLEQAKSYADNAAFTVKNDLLNGAGEAYDTLQELGELINDNKEAVEALEIIATNKADKEHSHDDKYYTESEIDEKTSAINTNISNIINGTTIVKNAESADVAKNANNAEKLGGESPSYYAKTSDIPTGALANKNIVSESDLDKSLAEKVNAASDGNHSHLNKDALNEITIDKISKWDNSLDSAKEYTDTQIALIPTPDVSGQINTHNASETAHNDIRNLINDLQSELNDKVDSEHSHDDKYYTESEIDEKTSAINAGIENITNGTTVVKNAEHAVNADIATTAISATNTENFGGKEPSYYAKTTDIPIGALASKDIVYESDLDRALAEKVNASSEGNHAHLNKGVLDGITADKISEWDGSLDSANAYTDTKTEDMATTTVVDNKISAHNTSTESHNDIRDLISSLTTKVTNFLDVDDETTDQLSEVLELIENNKGTIESITTNKVNVSDIVDNLTTAVANKVLSANQGVELKALIDALQEVVDGKADAGHDHAIADVTGLQDALNAKVVNTDFEAHTSVHAPSNAQANVIESIKVNGTVQTITSKSVDIIVPTDNKDLANGAGYLVASDIENKADKDDTYTKAEIDAKTVVDESLSETSVNPVQNKVVKNAISNLTSTVSTNTSSINEHATVITNIQNTITNIEEDVTNKLNEAKSYTDTQISLIPTPDVSGQISTHNTDSTAHNDIRTILDSKSNSDHNHDNVYDTKGTANNLLTNHNVATDAHNDIRLLISDLVTKLNNFLDVDDATTDQLSEVIMLINNNKGTLESLTTSKVNVADIIDNLTTNVTNKPLSAAQAVVLKGLIDALETELSNHTHNTYETKTDASAKLEESKSYTDTKFASIPTPDVSGQINEHNTSGTAHDDIRESVDNLKINAAYINAENNEDVEFDAPTGGGGTGNLVEISKADYELLSEKEKNADNVAYFIPDENVDGVDMGDSDISNIGDGTVTGAISELNNNFSSLIKTKEVSGNVDSTGRIDTGLRWSDGVIPLSFYSIDRHGWMYSFPNGTSNAPDRVLIAMFDDGPITGYVTGILYYIQM